MSQISLLCTLFSLLLVLSCSTDSEPAIGIPSEDDPNATEITIIDALNDKVSPLIGAPLSIMDVDLQLLDDLGETRLIGLGEASHGTKEIFELKHRIFEYFVRNHGYKAFVFEMDFSEALLFNAWVRHEIDGDIEGLMKEHMYFWTWRTTEVRDLLSWMRDYNSGKVDEEMISFYGNDVQTERYSIEYLRQIISEQSTENELELLTLLDEIDGYSELYRSNFTEELSVDIKEKISSLSIIFEPIIAQILEQQGIKSAAILIKVLEHLRQTEENLYENYKYTEFDLREVYMATNTLWYLDFLGEESKIILWAHNGHVGNISEFYVSQGYHLKESLGESYQIIGFSLAFGSVTAINGGSVRSSNILPTELNRDSYNWLFSQLDYPNFIIKTTSDNTIIDNYFSEQRPFLSIGASFDTDFLFYESLISTEFDYVIHLNDTEASAYIQ